MRERTHGSFHFYSASKSQYRKVIVHFATIRSGKFRKYLWQESGLMAMTDLPHL